MNSSNGPTQNELAPGGRLRAALNLANTVLVGRDENSKPIGITVDLAKELARRAGLDLELELFAKGGDVTDQVGAGWDICFLAVDPQRFAEITFSSPYLRIEGRFVVKPSCPVNDLADFDRLGLTIAVVRGSAYSLHLMRSIGAPRVHVFESKQEARRAFDAGDADAIVAMGSRLPSDDYSIRLIQQPFMSVSQAIGVPANRTAAAGYVSAILGQMTADGFVSRTLRKYGVEEQA